MHLYKVTNKINGKIYIGLTTKSLERRWQQHCTPSNTCSFLQKAIAKYGKQNFTIEELEQVMCPVVLSYKEQYYITKFNSLAPNGYNLTSGGEHSFKFSHIVIAKIAAANTGKKRTPEYKENCRQRQLGKIPSTTTRAKMSAARKGKPSGLKGRPWSDARRAAQACR